jgi:hypothetical protein
MDDYAAAYAELADATWEEEFKYHNMKGKRRA